MLISLLARMFRAPAVEKARERESDSDLQRRIVSALARGNVSLQCGHYCTEQDFDKQKDALRRVNFSA